MKTVTLKNGKQLTIQKAVIGDCREMISYSNRTGGESDNLTFGKNEFSATVESEIQIIENMDKGGLIQLFCGKIDGEIVSVGNVGLQVKKRLCHAAEMGISVAAKCWGLGVGTAMVDYMVNYTAMRGDIRVLHLEVRSDNKAAINIYQKAGFVKTGFHKGFLHVGDEFFDVDLMDKYFY